MSSRKQVLWAAATLMLVAAVGCNFPSGQGTPPPQTPAGDVALTPTSLPATSVQGGVATNTPGAGGAATTAPAGGGAITRISFAPGATFANVDGSVAAHGTAKYSVNVGAGQLLDVSATSVSQPQIAVIGADGKAPANVLDNTVSFRGAVPATQDYTITVTGGDQPITFGLTVMIPERVSFPQGATQVNVEGHILGMVAHQYVINVAGGQLLDLELSTQDGIHTSVYGADGDVLQSGMGEGAGFRGVVPSTQDYIVQVLPNKTTVDYTLTVIIPQRIMFGAGETFTQKTGNLPANGALQYVINLPAGQVIEVSAGSARTAVSLAIYGVDGTVLKSGMGSDGSFRGKVPTAQDYIIQLGSSQGTGFVLSVAAPVRISFDAGATSATLTGKLASYQFRYYVIAGSAGQTLDVVVAPEGVGELSVYGLDAAVLPTTPTSSHLTGKLPTTQDYLIIFHAPEAGVEFKIVVTVK